MINLKPYLFLLTLPIICAKTNAQSIKTQQGILLKSGTSIKLAGIQVLNKNSMLRTQSNSIGIFSIQASSGDTLTFSSDNFKIGEFIVTDFTDKLVYLQPIIHLAEVQVKESSLKADILETKKGYREKSVFYTGTPHYYYLVLKPMTFIYENFKSEVIDARKFNRYATRELASYKITLRFNDASIKKVVPITDAELENFEITYMPTEKQIDSWNDYQLINYIKYCYADFKKTGPINTSLRP